MDGLLTIGSFFIAYYIRDIFFGSLYGHLSQFSRYTWIVLMAAIIIPIFMTAFKSYERMLEDKYSILITRTIMSVFASIIGMSAILFLTGDKSLSRLFLGIFGCTEVIVILIERIALRALIYFYSKNIVHKRNILIVGCGKVGKLYYERIKEQKHLDINIIGFLALNESQNASGDNNNIIGTIDELGSIAKQHNVREVIVALSTQEYGNLKDVISMCDREGLRVSILPAYFELLKVNMKVENMFGIPIINVRDVPLDSIGNRVLKRTFDIIV